MRIGGAKKVNCTMVAPGYGRLDLSVVVLGHGMSIASSAGVARTKRTFYPFVRTSGAWYVQAAFATTEERQAANAWMLLYTSQMVDASRPTTIRPIAVTVASEGFFKLGYPTASIEFGDLANAGAWFTRYQFTSATDPEVTSRNASRFRPARDSAAANFYPGGLNSSAPLPAPEWAFVDPDGPWTGGGGGNGPRYI